jgi:UDPglucose 6-dehydrogenase
VELAREASGGSFVGRRIAVLGAAFKPHSDDIRDSPALNVAAQAALQGADVVVTDPAALDNAQAHWPDLSYAATAVEAVAGADVVVLATEWPEYVAMDPKALAAIARNRTVIDARNALDPVAWRAAGWSYRGLGGRGDTTATRPTVMRRAA